MKKCGLTNNNIMKKIYIFLLLIIAIGCEEYEDDRLDFSNSYPIYVEFESASNIVVKEGESAEVKVVLRERIYNDVTVTYTITGAIEGSGSVVIPKGNLNATITVNAPEDSKGESAEIKIVEATGDIAVGRDGTKTVRKIIVE